MVPGTGNGLDATYYEDAAFGGAATPRKDARVDFPEIGNPAVTTFPDAYSARWNGLVLAPQSGDFTFSVIPTGT